MKAKLLLVALTVGILSAANSFAAVDYQQQAGNCPNWYLDKVDGEFGSPASDETTCIKKRDNIKVVLNMSSDVTKPLTPLNQVLNNAKSMLANYENIYGITIGNGLEMSIVAHFKGAKSLLNDASNSEDNKNAVKYLLDQGVHIYMCQTTMRGNGWKTSQLIASDSGEAVVEQVPGGVLALVDFAQGGWAVITP